MAIGLPGGDRRSAGFRDARVGVRADTASRARRDERSTGVARGNAPGGWIVVSRSARADRARRRSEVGRGGSTVGNAPRREELDEGGLAALENLGVEVGGGEIDGAGVSAEHQAHEGDREERDTHLDQDLREEWEADRESNNSRDPPTVGRCREGARIGARTVTRDARGVLARSGGRY